MLPTLSREKGAGAGWKRGGESGRNVEENEALPRGESCTLGRLATNS